eukprot:Pgem_evm1s5907
MDGAHMEKQYLQSVGKNDQAFKNSYYFNLQDTNPLKKILNHDIVDDLLKNIDAQAALAKEYQQLREDRERLRIIFPGGRDSVYMPVNLRRLLLNAKKLHNIKASTVSDLHPAKIIEGVNQLLDNLIIVPGNDPLSIDAQRSATQLFKMVHVFRN